MTTVAYYPGCTLKANAAICDVAGRAVAAAFDIDLVELERWNCCGSVFGMSADERMAHVASLRNLIRVQESGANEVVTMCAMCQNTLRQVDSLVRRDNPARTTMNGFLDEEPDYRGGVTVTHYLTLLDRIGVEVLRERVTKPLTGLAVAPYYGCTLLRPAEVAIDDWEDPSLMERLLGALGADVIRDPLRVECCGAHLIVDHPDAVAARTRAIVDSARARGAEALTVMCPLCFHNLDRDHLEGTAGLPVFYLTQLVALALGLAPELWLDEGHTIDPRPLLRARSLLEPEVAP